MAQQLERYASLVGTHYDHLKQEGLSRLLQVWPRFQLYNHFERFVILNLLIVGIYLVLSFITNFSLRGLYEKTMKVVYDLPFIKKIILKEMAKAREDILKAFPPHLRVENEKIPYKTPAITFGDDSEQIAMKGMQSGNRYAQEHHSKFIVNLSKLFAYANPLHVDTFPLVKQMEVQVISMTAEAIGLKDEKGQPCGTVNSGGTESIIMAIYAYREYKMKECGVIRPNLVICQTGHAAGIKACKYFDIEIRLIPFDANYQMDLGKMKRAIDSNTICVYTSYPNYPFGTADQISLIAPYCHKRGVPVHLDMCLGGFVSPFIEKDWKISQGVTSISADVHKYGLSAKGASVLLFSSDRYRKHQYFVTSYWPGGLYGTPGMAGSRSGVYIASAWISMMKLGRKGYEDNARILHDTLVKISDEIEKVGYEVLSKHNICVLSFRHRTISTNDVQTYMKERGWGMAVNQKPFSFQFSFTPTSCVRGDDMIKDLKECVEWYAKNPSVTKEAFEVAVYGVCTQVKDDGKKELMFSGILDTYVDLC